MSFSVDKDKKILRESGFSTQNSATGAFPASPSSDPELDELYRKLKAAKPNQDAIAAALESAQHLDSEMDAEQVADGFAQELTNEGGADCSACGYHNRDGNKFCGRCGQPVDYTASESGAPEGWSQPDPFARRFAGQESDSRSFHPQTHHHHHHYHHHYFPGGGQEAMPPRPVPDALREAEKLRPSTAHRGESMGRVETAVRRVSQEWVLACNTKHLDDLLDLYIADAMVMRSNYAPVRGAAAIREFFFGALHAGLGEVELDAIRVEITSDMAYETGRCKALIPGAAGKRREERGKYLCVLARQSNGEWKIAADCWSSDLSLTTLESDAPPLVAPKTSHPRKS
jgi:uncharacterized protein (TIGR02246 family)